MTSIPNARALSLSNRLHSMFPLIRVQNPKAWISRQFRFDCCCLRRNRKRIWSQPFLVRACGGDDRPGDRGRIVEDRNALRMVGSALRGTIGALPPAISVMTRNIGSRFAIGLFIALSVLTFAARQMFLRSRRNERHGSVADLVRRGQLRSDRRGISKPLKCDDPFNNPFMKVGKNSSSVEMFGKVYRLAPVTLTNEEQSSHQKRRSRAYQWKRPTIFLKEGDPIPPDVDPDTVRWIPANHPFATTVSDIDEDLAQSNVYQKDGVPFRIRAEHEALQKKLEALQNDEKLNRVAIGSSNLHDFERPFKTSIKPHEQQEDSSNSQHHGNITSTNPDQDLGSSDNKTSTDELEKP